MNKRSFGAGGVILRPFSSAAFRACVDILAALSGLVGAGWGLCWAAGRIGFDDAVPRMVSSHTEAHMAHPFAGWYGSPLLHFSLFEV